MVMFINAYCVPNFFSAKIVLISEHPIMKTRTKKTRDGKIERTYIEKGGANSVLFKLLEGELG